MSFGKEQKDTYKALRVIEDLAITTQKLNESYASLQRAKIEQMRNKSQLVQLKKQLDRIRGQVDNITKAPGRQ